MVHLIRRVDAVLPGHLPLLGLPVARLLLQILAVVLIIHPNLGAVLIRLPGFGAEALVVGAADLLLVGLVAHLVGAHRLVLGVALLALVRGAHSLLVRGALLLVLGVTFVPIWGFINSYNFLLIIIKLYLWRVLQTSLMVSL